MSFKNNINTDPRSFYFAAGGDDSQNGESLEKSKSTVAAAIASVNALSPPSSTTNPSSAICLGFGVFSENVTVPTGCLFSATNIELLSASGTTLTMSANSSAIIRLIATVQASTDTVLIAGIDGVSLESKAIVTGGTFSNAIHLTGDCDSLFFNIERILCEGASSAGVFDESSSGTPRVYNVSEILLDGNTSLGIFFDPSNPTAEGIMNIGSINEGAGSTGTQGIRVNSGIATLEINEMIADTAIQVNSSGTLNIIANKVSGDIIVNGTGVLNCKIVEHSGAVTVAATATILGIINNVFYGDVDVNGDLTATGTIEGSL